MKSIRTKGFKKLYSELPYEIKENAKKQYKLFKKNPNHPSLRTKMIGSTKNEKFKVFEISVGMGYRACYFIDSDIYVWFWIGSHSSFDKRF
ncbi:MAG TPA: hypothetical protein VJL89_02190 [Thermodesulfovibrionia bacterium]|nr:hypothetical protein [Thermodesulfovibrionia bacterium]